MEKMNPVVHFEMPAEDRTRMANFYTKVFGWKAQFMGEEMGNYVTVETTKTDNNGMPAQPGAINGGFYQKSDNMPSNCPSIVISVNDINEYIKTISEAGGTILGKPVDIPQVGKYVSFRDTEGNACSILQPLIPEDQKAEVQEFGLTGEI